MTELSTSQLNACPFSNPLIVKEFSCEYALEVTRRDGPGIACVEQQACQHCQSLYETIRTATLTAMGLEHDLTQVPSSLLKKVQFGSILALQEQLNLRAGRQPADGGGINNISAVVAAVRAENESWSCLDLAPIVSYIQQYQLARRANRRR